VTGFSAAGVAGSHLIHPGGGRDGLRASGASPWPGLRPWRVLLVAFPPPFWADVPVVSAALAAVEGSAWVIGAPLHERGAGLAEEPGSSPGPPGREDTRSS
jgi:hypothetical protein